jgi:hypothetical protein
VARVYGFPRSKPRLIYAGRRLGALEKFYVSGGLASRGRWRIARWLAPPANPLWAPVSPAVRDLFLSCAALLRSDYRGVIGVVSSPGANAKMLIVPSRRTSAVLKVAMSLSASSAIRREAGVLERIGRDGPAEAAPRLHGRYEVLGFPAIAIERCYGDAPSPHDFAALSLALQVIDVGAPRGDWTGGCSACQRLQDRAVTNAIDHGDFVPWNVRWSDEARTEVRVLDWEGANLDLTLPSLLLVMSWYARSTIVQGGTPGDVVMHVQRYLAASGRGHEAALVQPSLSAWACLIRRDARYRGDDINATFLTWMDALSLDGTGHSGG